MTGMSRQDLLRFAAILGALAIALTLWVELRETPIAGDLRVAREIQGFDRLRDNEGIINLLGTLPWQLAAIIAFTALSAFGHRLWGLGSSNDRERNAAIVTMGAVTLLRFLSQVLKEIVRAPRPTEAFGLRIDDTFTSYGFPSGHVYTDVLVYGAIAVLAPVCFGRKVTIAVRVACVALIVLSGPARVVVGAHWPSDTVGGYLYGGAALCLALVAGKVAAGQK